MFIYIIITYWRYDETTTTVYYVYICITYKNTKQINSSFTLTESSRTCCLKQTKKNNAKTNFRKKNLNVV